LRELSDPFLFGLMIITWHISSQPNVSTPVRPGRWSLYFGRFTFTLTYRPGSRKVKPDALSHQFVSEESPSSQDTILPPTCVVAAVAWEIESKVREAQWTQADPGYGPQGCLFVPDSVRSQVLQWAHTFRFACHPGMKRTLSRLKRHFWWPWRQILRPMLQPACYVLKENSLIVHQLVYYIHSLFPGPTSLSTLSLVYLLHKVTLSSSLSLTVFPRMFFLWLSQIAQFP